MVGEAKENHSVANRVVQGPYLLTLEFENPQLAYFNPPKHFQIFVYIFFNLYIMKLFSANATKNRKSIFSFIFAMKI